MAGGRVETASSALSGTIRITPHGANTSVWKLALPKTESLGQILCTRALVGRRLETADAWIASTAIAYDAPLITHNGSDYSGVPGLKVITEVFQ